MDISSWHVGTGTGVVALVIVGLIWRSIKFVMKLIALILVVAVAAGAWAAYEYHTTGHLPFDSWSK
jgi:hypothetical protein